MADTTREEILWEGHPSHVQFFWTYLVCGLLFFLVVPLFIIVYKWLQIRAIKYTLTTQRLTIRRGILNYTTEEIELYRIRDFALENPFIYRIFGVGNIRMVTSDKSVPLLVLEAIPDSDNLRNLIRTHVEKRRDEKGVRELDIE